MKNIAGKTIYSVSEVNSLARQSLEELSFWVEGEVSSFRGLNDHYRYIYFDIKDPQTGYKLPCLLEPEIYHSLDFDLADGQKVLCLGNLTLWESAGRYQMYVHKVEPFGEGLLLAQLEELKRMLEKKGYFDTAHKVDLPKFPIKIAVISSRISDAWQDFKKHSVDLFPIIAVTFFDVLVQGPDSAGQIEAAIKVADKMTFDAIVIVRGGGSLEDLSSFNDEKVADAIYRAKTCVVVGVGHEKDVTIASLVADIAASTPTDAAKIITHDYLTLATRLDQYLYQLENWTQSTISRNSQRLDLAFHQLVFQKEKFSQLPKSLEYLRQGLAIHQESLINQNQTKLTIASKAVKNSWHTIFQENRIRLDNNRELLSLLSPKNTLRRGYSITRDENSRLIRDAQSIAIGANINVEFARGRVSSKVLKKELE